MPDQRTHGLVCPMCGEAFLLKARFDAHREAEIPGFVAASALKRRITEGRFRARQVDIGRMNEAGEWVPGWRPSLDG